ncbi:MAG: DUF429 domain-containing protein [Acidimicrobiia bacterium]|nr:DUF429 domain-containing protein [Acidimicrobiia bacterium]
MRSGHPSTSRIEQSELRVVGLDGWKRGWVGVELTNGAFSSAAIFGCIDEVLDAYPDATIAADIPIGLPSTGRREADLLARQRLGIRRSSVFHCPPRDVIETETYAAANALAKERHGFGISKQSYMLRPKILEVDRAIGSGATIFEVHPEVVFHALVGGDVPSKKTYAGQRTREAALRSVGIELPADIGASGVVPVDDLLDAAAVAYVAHRISLGTAHSLPMPPQADERGRPMAIWF